MTTRTLPVSMSHLDLGEARRRERRCPRGPASTRRGPRAAGGQRGTRLLPGQRLALPATCRLSKTTASGSPPSERRDALGHLDAGVVRRVLDRGREGGRRRGAAGGVGVAVGGVADLLDDVVDLQPQFFGDDRADVGPRAGAQVLRADGGRDRAVLADRHVDRRTARCRRRPRRRCRSPCRAAAGPCRRRAWGCGVPSRSPWRRRRAGGARPCRRRSSCGTRPGPCRSCTASSSISDSMANDACGWPGARSATDASSLRVDRRRLAVGVLRPCTGTAGRRGWNCRCPAARAAWPATATSVPSLFAPALNFWIEPGPLPAARNSSRRVSAIFTGACSFLASRQAHCPAMPMPNFEPNPPPMCWTIAVTLVCCKPQLAGRVAGDRERPLGGGVNRRRIAAAEVGHDAVGLEAAVVERSACGTRPRRRRRTWPARRRSSAGRPASAAAAGPLRCGTTGCAGLGRLRRGDRVRQLLELHDDRADGVLGRLDRRRGHGGDGLALEPHLVADLDDRHHRLDALDLLRGRGSNFVSLAWACGEVEEPADRASPAGGRPACRRPRRSILTAPSTRVRCLLSRRCLSLGPQDGPLSSTSISTSPIGTPSTILGP